MVDFAFLDSGTGGIPYLLHMLDIFPKASCVYVGDTANFPYGEKSHEQIVQCVIELVKKIIQRFDPKIIVIACNTMSVNALNVLREVYPETQFVGTVPAIKLAASVSKKRVIGLLATHATVQNPYNMDLKNHFAADCKMVLRGDPDLISFIEHESFTATESEREAACKPAVDYFSEQGCDVIILGCTHFLNLKKEMQKVCSSDITVVDSVDGVVNRAIDLYGALRGVPAVRVAETASAGAQGEERFANEFCFRFNDNGKQNIASPSLKSKLFVTGFSDKNDEKEYNVLCSRFGLEFNGLL